MPKEGKVLQVIGPVVDVEFEEVEIGRRLYRSGENEYLLNRRRIRLRDLVENVDVHCRRFGHMPRDVVQFFTDRGYEGRYIDARGERQPLPRGIGFHRHAVLLHAEALQDGIQPRGNQPAA